MQLFFKYARLFDPVKVSELNPCCSSDIDHLKAFPFLSDKLEDLKKELPSYLAKVDSILSAIRMVAEIRKRTPSLINSMQTGDTCAANRSSS